MKHIALVSLLLSSSLAAQDFCATAPLLTDGIYTVAAVNGTDPAGPDCTGGNNPASHREWYSYTAAGVLNVTVSTDLPINAGKDTRLHVYSGSCGSLVCVAGDDDSGSGYLSTASFISVAGATYIIVFDDPWSSVGFDFQISSATPPPPPPPGTVTFTATTNPSGNSECVVDMNGDHLDDLVSASTNSINISYQQPGGTFLTTAYPVTGVANSPSWSIAAGDIDGNGYTDLQYGGGNGVSFLMANGTGTGFTAVNFPQYIFSQRTNMLDINNDGHLDAFVCHDVDANCYFMNDGLGNLTYYQGGFGCTCGNYGSVFTDVDNDGDVDMFVAKCGCDPVDLLYRNDGNGVFTSIATTSDFADNHQSWSSAWGDFDNDGDMDVLVGSSSSNYHKLMRNDGGVFTNVTANSGFDTFTGQSIEWTTHDFNNDGFLDILGGNKLMMGNGAMQFSANPGSMGNAAIGDINSDGFLDRVLGSVAYINDGNSFHHLRVNTVGTISNTDAIGARVTVNTASRTQIRDVKSGDGFAYMSTLSSHFGLGTDSVINSVTVRWPSGLVQTVYNPPVDEPLEIIEGISTQVNELVLSPELRVFPNPSQGMLFLSGDVDLTGSNITVVDMTGQVAMRSSLVQGRIDVSSLVPGAYVVQVQKGEKLMQSRFLKQ